MKFATFVLFVFAGAGQLSCPAPAAAQAAPARIAYLISDGELSNSCEGSQPGGSFHAFREGMRALGYVPGRNIVYECRSAKGDYQRLGGMAAELLRTGPTLIVASAVPASLAVKRATSAIPIVSVYTADPVGLGLVESLRRPGGNVTGISALAAEYVAKSLELLREAAPRTTRVGVLGDRRNPTFEVYRRELEPAGRAMEIALEFVSITTPAEIDAAFAKAKKDGAQAVLVMHQPFTFFHGKYIAELAARHRLPTMSGSYEAVEAGGLMSYAVSIPEIFRQAARIADRILKGAKPADMPMEQPTRFELVINLGTAKALGLKLPQSLLVRADRVIE